MKQLNIPIVYHCYNLYQNLFLLHKKIPKTERFSLWQRAENLLLDIIELLMGIGSLQRIQHGQELLKASKKLDLLKLLIRLASDIKIIDQKQFLLLQQKIDEIGRMLGGWIKSTEKPS